MLYRRMALVDPSGTDWTGQEIDLVVTDYIDMLRLELSGQQFIKFHRNEVIQKLTGRSHGSIEFKHQNISAILDKLGYPWIKGYKPRSNYQKSLLDGIERHLSSDRELLAVIPQQEPIGFNEGAALFFEPPPPYEGHSVNEPETLKRLVSKFDPARRDARNKKLGFLGEEIVFNTERRRLEAEGRPDLASKIIWISQEQGDEAGYDILSFETSGEERLLEVKTTTGHRTTPFYISENERALSDERPNDFRLVRLFDFARQPRAFLIAPPLSSSLLLQPTTYRASF